MRPTLVTKPAPDEPITLDDPESRRVLAALVQQALADLIEAMQTAPNGRAEAKIVLVGHVRKLTRESRVERPPKYPT